MRKEPGNRQSKSQTPKVPQQPHPKVGRIATIKITPNAECKADVQTGNLSDLEMYYHLNHLTKAFAEKLISNAEEVVGDDPDAQAKYLDWRIEQSGINE